MKREFRAEAVDGLEPIHLGHGEIGDQDFRRTATLRFERLAAIRGELDGMPFRVQRKLQRRCEVDVVVDDEDAFARHAQWKAAIAWFSRSKATGLVRCASNPASKARR